MRGSRSLIPGLAALGAAALLGACSNAPMGWNDGPGWRLSGSPTSIPPERVYGAVAAGAPQGSVGARPAPATGRAGEPRVVIVGPDDTITGISNRYRTSVSAIMAANNLADPRITPGQRLVIPSR